MPINHIANMVKSQLNMSGADSEKGTGLGEAEFIEDARAKILDGLARVKASSEPDSEVGQPSEAEKVAADEIARLT